MGRIGCNLRSSNSSKDGIMGVSCAEDHVTHCHRCGYEFTKKCSICDVEECATCNDFIAIAPKRGTLEFCYLCNRCMREEGGVWWVGKVPKYKVEK